MPNNSPPKTAAWPAIFAIAVGVAALITAELLPVSLLTPMAQGLSISEGMAGQSVSVTAFVAIFASLFVTTATRGIDRRFVVMGFSVLLIASSLIVAVAPNYAWMLVGRVLLGLALGGFWAMAVSLAMRLVPASDVPKALSIVFGGVSVAMVASAPLGSFLGGLIGWRGVFIVAAAFGVICLIWQAITLPKMPPRGSGNFAAVVALLGRTGVCLPMLAIFAVFAGQFSVLTYLRPYFERVSGFGVEGVSFVLLIFGVANFVGTSLSSIALRHSLRITLAFAPLVLAGCAIGLATFGTIPFAVVALIAIYGFGFGFVPVAWSTWVTRELGDDAESAGGLQVAVIQLANTTGAGLGGYALDLGGPLAPILFGAALLALTSALVIAAVPRPISRVA
ncbi:MFS transporter [Paracoccus litorisediminis]|uniref:MFS transporter n=1 Tax=Paracoccus litorisediminis TaxID=2006130 RepID=A0A844HQX6_9RHOB|nr:MFS transporter [Paracoccus litorisediminis]MTH62246.1 MFS transporter [Paracoccus litorisediminis]